MCGRYTILSDSAMLREHFGLANEVEGLTPRYNLAPTQDAPVIVIENGERVLKRMRWGLVPFWAKDERIGNKLINARAETIHEKPAFRNLLKRKRCLVVADGFYEWVQVKGERKKQPLRIVVNDQEVFAFAGLWDRWRSPQGDELETFTIVTTKANDLIAPIHQRMPVILHPGDQSKWLDPACDETEPLLNLLQPYPADRMETYPVSKVVNAPGNDSPECIQPIGDTTAD